MSVVLIPTEDDALVLHGMVNGYKQIGWDVVIGCKNFLIRAAKYDAIHIQWPEEFVGYRSPPSRDQLEKLEKCLAWWKRSSRIILTVHNLNPHVGDHPSFFELFSLFYRYCDVITHYSDFSRVQILAKYPAAHSARHIVHHPDGCEATIDAQISRGSRRGQLGLKEDDFAILVFSQIRSKHEMALVKNAYDLAKVPKKRLVMAGKLLLNGGRWNRRITMMQWRYWLKSRNAVVIPEYIEEERISTIIDSCNVMIVPRLGGLNSAIIFAGMAFGRMLVAPDCGAYPEHLAHTRNLIYKTGDAASLARAIEDSSRCNTDEIGQENARLASTWRWKGICEQCVLDKV